MPTILKFNGTDVRKLIAHTVACDLHKPTIEQRLDIYGPDAWKFQPDENTRAPAGLWFVKDEGIYLLSNGEPGLFLEEIGQNNAVCAEGLLLEKVKRHFVVYAEGYNPRTDPDVWERSRAAVGGDDFVEYLGEESYSVLQDEDEFLSITVTKDHLRISSFPPEENTN